MFIAVSTRLWNRIDLILFNLYLLWVLMHIILMGTHLVGETNLFEKYELFYLYL